MQRHADNRRPPVSSGTGAPLVGVFALLGLCSGLGGSFACTPTSKDDAGAKPAKSTASDDGEDGTAAEDDTAEPVAADTDGEAEDDEGAAADVGEADAGEVDVPEDQAPPDYGLIKPPIPAPDPEELVIHGMAGYEVVAVYSKPDMESEKLGFIRLGSRMKVTERKGREGCAKGWYGLPEGGFACASKGLVVERDKEPYLHAEPPPPNLESPSPYEWAYVRKWNSPMWWRTPTSSELARATEERAIREAERTGEPLPGSEPPKPATPKPTTPKPAATGDGDGGDGGSPDLAALPKPEGASDADGGDAADGPDDAVPDDAPPKPEPAAAPPADDAPPADAEPEEPPPKLPLNPQHPWLEKGFFISLAGKVSEDDGRYWQTARGGYVSQSDAYKYEPKDFQGQVLSEDMTFPVGFVMARNGARLYELDDAGKLKQGKKVDKRTFLDFTEETEIGGKAYMVTTEGTLVRKDDVRMPTLQPLPKGLEPYDRWIDVDLSDQLLVAYEGTRPVYTTLVSTGRKGSEEEPFETPTGRWRIYSKQVTSNMDGATATDGNYAIQDVPWVMYFEGSYALHGAFWHRSFGHVRSHGCVNLGPSDARWLFMWTTPFLPSGWHGVNATDESPGTTVVVHE